MSDYGSSNKVLIKEENGFFENNCIFSHHTCKVNINVKTYEYGETNANGEKKKFYYINYTFSEINDAHPFNNEADSNIDAEGVTVSKNEMTDKMIQYLLMNNDNLENFSGRVTGNTYKISIMRALNNLWD